MLRLEFERRGRRLRQSVFVDRVKRYAPEFSLGLLVNIEKGRALPSEDILTAMAQALAVGPPEILLQTVTFEPADAEEPTAVAS